jgi:hypothetical protein
MSFWRNHTRAGMMLRSALGASDIASPFQGMTLAAYLGRRGALPDGPVPVSSFVDYGNWFQSRRLPDIDRRHVAQILTEQDGFLCGRSSRRVPNTVARPERGLV